MRLYNKFILLSIDDMNAIKEGREGDIPEGKLELAKEWLANLNKVDQKTEKPKEETILEDKEQE